MTDDEDEEEYDGNYEEALDQTHVKAESYKLEITNVTMQNIKYCVGLCATSVITTATFIDAGLITEADKRLVINHNKVKRAQ
ncbi:hypothetical protein E2320_004634 [Naja naja]|nr:hypothetical protein E2320_004634 [Naja naja]